jgi:hypothetical protein
LLESFTGTTKGLVSIDACNLPAPKFFKPSFSFRKPQFFSTRFDFVIERGNQTLRELYAVPERQFHRIGSELI